MLVSPWTTRTTVEIVVATAVLYFARLVVQRRSSSFARRHVVAKTKKDLPQRVEAFTESLWKFIYYGLIWIYGVYVSREYFENPLNRYNEFPETKESAALSYYFVLQFSFYLSSLIQHIDGTESVRGDWWQMLVHHLATLILVGVSYYTGLFRIGSVVFTLHDIVDVMLEFAKMGSYVKFKYDIYLWAVMTISWSYLRVYLYFRQVLMSVWLDISYLIDNHKVDASLRTYQIGLGLFLCVIFGLNCFWFGLMIKGMVKVFIKKEKFEGDSRDDDDIQNKES